MNRKMLLHEVRGKGEPIVLVPGGLSGWLSWIPHAERLSTERMVIRIQLRSIELAERDEPFPADYGPLTEVDALHATVNELSLESFDLAGWSSGGLVALTFALRYPERIRTLTIIEPDAYWILRETGHAARALAESERGNRSLEGQEVTVDDLKELLVREGLGKPGDNFESLPQWPVWVQNRQVLSVIGPEYDYNDSLERLRALEVPILAVKGTEGSEVLTTIVDDLVVNTPHSRLLELSGGHACHIENIDRFLEELTRHTATAV
jgi:pimeloyl-ACP methyl ester carboxylesterase